MYFIVNVNDDITKMPSNWNTINWHKYPVRMQITDGTLITIVSGKEYKDVCPMKGSKRNRKEIAKVVCNHICEKWGGTLEEITEFSQAFLSDLYATLGITI